MNDADDTSLFAVYFEDDGIKKVRVIDEESKEMVNRLFGSGGQYSHLDLIQVYDYESYRENVEERAENAHGMVRFAEPAYGDPMHSRKA